MNHPKIRRPITASDWAALIAIASTASFVISAISQSLVFYSSYKIVYFSVASPSDVLMGSFVIFAFLFGAFLMSIVGLILGKLTSSEVIDEDAVRAKRPWPLWKRVALCLGVAACSAVAIVAAGAAGYGDFRPYVSPGLKTDRSAIHLPPECRNRQVSWMGSNFAIIDCDERYLLVRNLDEIPMTTLEPLPN